MKVIFWTQIQPSVTRGLTVWLGYLLVIVGTWTVLDVAYKNLVSLDTILTNIILPLRLETVFPTGAISYLGW
ncbi:hypothetical protein [Falsihalocynthiibacter arcticus]|uniref:hypothetical protein n=1 Tax=Falsihalocynthiibacter arcticus TaxID=1579316 RepID=UPI000578FA8A|nr:hypothetical protein [Falsihalocynthiibacter arcticus]